MDSWWFWSSTFDDDNDDNNDNDGGNDDNDDDNDDDIHTPSMYVGQGWAGSQSNPSAHVEMTRGWLMAIFLCKWW